ncbi:MAG: ABC transporter permease [Bacteroidia bacterium]|jgi:lipopolysaccharide transport system permease protein|nr:ABC transporter permease [Bacteroidia bacterium]
MNEAPKNTTQETEAWSLVIKPGRGALQLRLGDIWNYRDLILLFVRRDFVAIYKQTVLGPLWFFIQPVLASLMYYVLFNRVAKQPTDGIPPILFYMSGQITWMYFSECLLKTSNTFVANANLFGKVYFPRLVVPVSIVISNMLRFGVQMLLLISVFLFYALFRDMEVQITSAIFFLPLLLIMMAGLGLGAGILISAMTTKYRDLQFLVGFGTQLLMFATPAVLSVKSLPDGIIKTAIELNPMTPVIQLFRHAFFNTGSPETWQLIYSGSFTLVLLLAGIAVFNRVEKSFMDTV